MSTPSQAKMSELQTDPNRPASAWGSFEELFGKQKSYFTADATKAYAWRIDQLERLVRMLKENYQRFADASRKDFKVGALGTGQLSSVSRSIQDDPRPNFTR